MTAPPQSRSIFISYNHEDRAWRDRIASSLADVGLQVLDDTLLNPSQDWMAELQRLRESAQAAILVLTTNFLRSETIQKEELPHLLELQRKEQLAIFPVIAEPCDWQSVEDIRRIQAFPQGGKPLSKKSNEEVQQDLQRLAGIIAGRST